MNFEYKYRKYKHKYDNLKKVLDGGFQPCEQLPGYLLSELFDIVRDKKISEITDNEFNKMIIRLFIFIYDDETFEYKEGKRYYKFHINYFALMLLVLIVELFLFKIASNIIPINYIDVDTKRADIKNLIKAPFSKTHNVPLFRVYKYIKIGTENNTIDNLIFSKIITDFCGDVNNLFIKICDDIIINIAQYILKNGLNGDKTIDVVKNEIKDIFYVNIDSTRHKGEETNSINYDWIDKIIEKYDSKTKNKYVHKSNIYILFTNIFSNNIKGFENTYLPDTTGFLSWMYLLSENINHKSVSCITSSMLEIYYLTRLHIDPKKIKLVLQNEIIKTKSSKTYIHKHPFWTLTQYSLIPQSFDLGLSHWSVELSGNNINVGFRHMNTIDITESNDPKAGTSWDNKWEKQKENCRFNINQDIYTIFYDLEKISFIEDIGDADKKIKNKTKTILAIIMPIIDSWLSYIMCRDCKNSEFNCNNIINNYLSGNFNKDLYIIRENKQALMLDINDLSYKQCIAKLNEFNTRIHLTRNFKCLNVTPIMFLFREMYNVYTTIIFNIRLNQGDALLYPYYKLISLENKPLYDCNESFNLVTSYDQYIKLYSVDEKYVHLFAKYKQGNTWLPENTFNISKNEDLITYYISKTTKTREYIMTIPFDTIEPQTMPNYIFNYNELKNKSIPNTSNKYFGIGIFGQIISKIPGAYYGCTVPDLRIDNYHCYFGGSVYNRHSHNYGDLIRQNHDGTTIYYGQNIEGIPNTKYGEPIQMIHGILYGDKLPMHVSANTAVFGDRIPHIENAFYGLHGIYVGGDMLMFYPIKGRDVPGIVGAHFGDYICPGKTIKYGDKIDDIDGAYYGGVINSWEINIHNYTISSFDLGVAIYSRVSGISTDIKRFGDELDDSCNERTIIPGTSVKYGELIPYTNYYRYGDIVPAHAPKRFGDLIKPTGNIYYGGPIDKSLNIHGGMNIDPFVTVHKVFGDDITLPDGDVSFYGKTLTDDEINGIYVGITFFLPDGTRSFYGKSLTLSDGTLTYYGKPITLPGEINAYYGKSINIDNDPTAYIGKTFSLQDGIDAYYGKPLILANGESSYYGKKINIVDDNNAYIGKTFKLPDGNDVYYGKSLILPDEHTLTGRTVYYGMPIEIKDDKMAYIGKRKELYDMPGKYYGSLITTTDNVKAYIGMPRNIIHVVTTYIPNGYLIRTPVFGGPDETQILDRSTYIGMKIPTSSGGDGNKYYNSMHS